MEDLNTIFKIIDDCIQQRGYKLTTPKPDLNVPGDTLYKYRRIDPPRKTISTVWNSERGYFMIQQVYRRRINDPMFLIRFKELENEEELNNDMNRIFSDWNE